MNKSLWLLPLLTLSGAAFARPAPEVPPIGIDAYYIPGHIKYTEQTQTGPQTGTDDGDGFGGRLTIPFGYTGLRFNGEYQSVRFSDSDLDVSQFRLGATWMTPGPVRVGLVGEYIDLTLDGHSYGKSNPTGYGVHGRLEADLPPMLSLYGQMGYVNLDASDTGTLDGFEYLVGVLVQLNRQFGVFADYRGTHLENQAGSSTDLSDARLGVRFLFGQGLYY